MPKESVTASGTLPRVSPRPANELPPDVVKRLRRAIEHHKRGTDKLDTELRAEVVAALADGSIRQVAAVTGLSPTTVHAWSKGEDR